MIEKIGINAGIVWHVLEKGRQEMKTIRKTSKLTEKEVYAAMGWLAREGKISITEEGKEIWLELHPF